LRLIVTCQYVWIDLFIPHNETQETSFQQKALFWRNWERKWFTWGQTFF